MRKTLNLRKVYNKALRVPNGFNVNNSDQGGKKESCSYFLVMTQEPEAYLVPCPASMVDLFLQK